MKLKQSIAQRGFGAIAAIVVLVMLSALAAAIVSLSTTQQKTSTQDVLSSRAWQAASSGNEWGLYQAKHAGDWSGPSTTCDTGKRTVTLNLTADTGFYVTVSCSASTPPYNEGEITPGVPQTVRIYTIVATACPSSSCPQLGSNVANPNYVERTRVVIAQ